MIGPIIGMWNAAPAARSNPNLISADPNAWRTKLNLTITGDATAYDVAATAGSTATMLQTAYVATSTAMTLSLEMQNGNRGYAYVALYDGGSSLSEGNVVFGNGAWSGTAGVTVTDMGSGWRRVVMPVTTVVGHTIYAYAIFGGATEVAGAHVYVRKLKLENGRAAT